MVILVDENREQTLAIQARQREAQTFEEFVRAETAIRVCANQCNAQRLLIQLHDYVRLRSQELSIEGLENVRFTRREIRERLKLGQTRLAAHLSRLVQYEYVQTYPINGRKLHCGLNWDGRDREGELILDGLVDPKALSEPAPNNHATVGPRTSVIGLKASIIAPLCMSQSMNRRGPEI